MTSLQMTPYLTEEKIQKRVQELGAILTDKFSGKEIVAVCVLKGSFMFYSDLIRNINADVTCEFFGVSSYHGASSTGEVKVTLDLARPIEDKHVLLVEDIVDTGLTMNYLKNSLIGSRTKIFNNSDVVGKARGLKGAMQS
jgi:hypoxanthine phosphoribosyltransferase